LEQISQITAKAAVCTVFVPVYIIGRAIVIERINGVARQFLFCGLGKGKFGTYFVTSFDRCVKLIYGLTLSARVLIKGKFTRQYACCRALCVCVYDVLLGYR